MTARFLPPLLLAVMALSASAKGLSPNALTSCVGKQFMPLQIEATSAAAAQQEVCAKSQHVHVCRTMLDGEQPDNRTMKISVAVNGTVHQEWFESADPAYWRHVHVFLGAASRGAPAKIVIASQQSESQGMGVQEWQVNAIGWNNAAARTTFTTSEFGPKGALVLDATKPGSACKLLLTRWESRKTKAGDRLFLVGTLADLNAAENEGTTPLAFRRFDQRLEKLRQASLPGRPLIYFSGPIP